MASKPRSDYTDYRALLELAEQDGLGYRAAAKRVGISPKRARRLYQAGAPALGLDPISDVTGRRAATPKEASELSRGSRGIPPAPIQGADPAAVVAERAATPVSLAAIEEQVRVQHVVEDAAQGAHEAIAQGVHEAAQRARAEAARETLSTFETELADLATLYAEHEHKLLRDRVEGMPIEAAIVKQTRGASAFLLGHVIKLLQAAGPQLERMAAQLREADLGLKEGLAVMMQLTRLSHRVVDLGDKAMGLQRRLFGEPESILGVHQDSGLSMSDAEAEAEISHLLNAAEHMAKPVLELVPQGEVLQQ